MFDELNCNQCCPEREVNYVKPMTSLIEVCLVHKGDEFYNQGRKLAENVYRQVWGTENLLDGNDYGVVVAQNGKILGNLNIQFKRSGKLLKSEVFFGENHWQNHSNADHSEIAELSALAIAQDAPKELRRSIMRMLILGMQNLCYQEGIKFLVTVQHDYLIRILSKSLHLPFFLNNDVSKPQGNTPCDGYWRRPKLPRVYCLDTNSRQTVEACSSFFSYLHNIPIVFCSKSLRGQTYYSGVWHKAQQTVITTN